MISFTILTILILSTTLNCQKTANISKLINDIIKNERVSSVLWAKTCWSKSDDFNFIQNFEIPIQIVKSNTPVNLPMDGSINKQWLFVDMRCERRSAFLSTVNEKYFAHPYRWIIVDAANDSIENLAFLPDSNIILANEDLNTNQYILKQIYRVAKEKPLIFEEFGMWSHDNGLVDLRTTRILSRRRRNLHGHQLKASTVFIVEGSENHTDLEDYRTNMVDSASKISYLISQHWIETANATMETDVQRTWGYQNSKTGEFNGMFGRLQRKEVDIGATIIFMTPERVEYLEYLSMSFSSDIAFILRSPPISYVSNIYYLPFTGVVWICLILLVILCTSIIFLILKCRLLPEEDISDRTVSDCILYAVASSCQMGSMFLTKLLSARISMFVFSIALLFIFTSFTANIVALLQSTTKSIRTISDLQNPAIGIGVENTPYNMHYFRIETEPTRKLLYQTRIAPPNGPDAFMNVSHGISLVRQGMFAFHAETNTGYREMERTFLEYEKCGLVEIKFLGMSTAWTVTQKHSPYKEILKISIFKIREHGIQTREKSRVYISRPKCNSDGKNFGSVRLLDCYAALLVFAYGCLFSLIMFGIEKGITQRQRMFPIKILNCIADKTVQSDSNSENY